MNPERPPGEAVEEEQSPERVKELLREAFEAGRVIAAEMDRRGNGEVEAVSNLGIMDMDETHVELTEVDENGEPGASCWVPIERIKKVK